jgi:type VI secretion system protein ImpD
MKHINDELMVLLQQLDARIDNQVDAILHVNAFQQLEAIWQGLHLLINSLPADSHCRLRMLNVSYKEAVDDLRGALDIEQSHLFKCIVHDAFEHPGGEPFGCIIGDYCFSPTRLGDDLFFLRQMGLIGAAAFVPFIASASNAFLNPLPDAWQVWQQTPLSCFVALLSPNVLLRDRYQRLSNGNHRLDYQEKSNNSATHCWGHLVYHYAQVICLSFHETGWFANICVTVDNLIYPHANTHYSQIAVQQRFTKQTVEALAKCGVIALQDDPIRSEAKFLSSASQHQSNQMPKQLSYLLCAARFAHYIKVMMRDKMGRFAEPDVCERFIEKWILQYCAKTQANQTASARYPLYSASVRIEQNDFAGHYDCHLSLLPNYQFQAKPVPVHLTTVLSRCA